VTAGILAGEGDANEIASRLRNLAFGRVSGLAGTLKSLADLGISTNGNDNNLNLDDETKLDAALANNLTAVQDLFANDTNGVAVSLSVYMDKTIGDGGTLPTKQSTLTKQAADINTQVADLERLVQADSQRMTDEFVAMETAQARLNKQLQYLQQSFGNTTTTSSKA
jgi:flagellar hook-associated protein 2